MSVPNAPADMSLDHLRAHAVAAFPELADARFALLAAGWDCVALDVDDTLILKFPREADAQRALVMEAALLEIIRPAVDMPVPDLHLVNEPVLFSRHAKIAGEHLVTAQYDRLAEIDRDRLAEAMALFYAQIHALPAEPMTAAGAAPIDSWLDGETMLRAVTPALPEDLRPFAARSIAAWQALPPDPYDTTYGFFDGHGWNMAFDHEARRLNGIYDFGDSGFGDLHQEFVYGNFISRDLTARTISAYERITGRPIDRERVELLSGVLRLWELALEAENTEHRDGMIEAVVKWVRDAPTTQYCETRRA